MNKPIRSFCSAKTCSTRERIFDLALLARRIASGIGRPFGLLTMDMADEAVPFHELLVGGRSVSGVRPDAARRVGLVEKSIAQTAALIGGGVRRAPFANEAETAIERDVVLIAEDRNRHIDGRHRAILARLGLGVFDCPARVAILLAELRGLVFPVVGDAPVLDRLLLVLGVALTRSGDQARIDDLARHGEVTGLPKRRIEALEQWPDGAGLREFLPEQPNRPGVGDAIRQSKSEKTHEGQPIIDQEFGAFVR